MVERHVKIKGRVQGVFFRQSTKEQADALGLFGWVKNCSDGTVEALFQGAPSVIDRMMAWLHMGPTTAKVSGVRILSQKGCTKCMEGFTILHE